MLAKAKRYKTHIHSIVQMMYDEGIHLVMGTDFGEFKRLAQQQPEKAHLHPAFDVDENPDGQLEGSWIIGHRRGGEIVHTQAIKLIDLGDKPFRDYLSNNSREYRSYGYDFDLDRTGVFMSEAAARISGQVTYHGELWLKGGPTGIRGGSNVILLTRLMLLLASERWDPDYMIGLQSPMTACRGLSAREGYARCEQRSIVWHPKDGSEPIEDWLVWMSAEEAAFNLRLPPEFFATLFEKPLQKAAEAQSMVA